MFLCDLWLLVVSYRVVGRCFWICDLGWTFCGILILWLCYLVVEWVLWRSLPVIMYLRWVCANDVVC